MIAIRCGHLGVLDRVRACMNPLWLLVVMVAFAILVFALIVCLTT